MKRIVVGILLALAATAYAERLPARVYTTADGLSNDRIDRGTRDPRGFLWFATGEGVSRFDGQHFDRFGIADGLPGAHVLDILASSDGVIWAATEGGIAWLDPASPVASARFTTISHDIAWAVYEDARGTVWGGTDDGLVALRRPHAAIGYSIVKLADGRQPQVYSIACDPRDGTLWLATWLGLWRYTSDGSVERYRVAPEGERDDRLSSVLFDREHRLWLTHVTAKIVMVAESHTGARLAPEGVPLWDAAASSPGLVRYETAAPTRRSLFEDSRGVIWIGTVGQLVRYDAAGFHPLATDSLPVDHALAPCVEDAAGNLWLGSDMQGLVRLAPDGFTAFDLRDGIESGYVHGFVENDGGFFAITWSYGHILARFDGQRFEALRPKQRPGVVTMAWGAGQTAFVDSTGAWWYPTGEGAARYPAHTAFADLARTEPELMLRPPELPGRDIFQLFEDRHRDIWIVTLSNTGIVRWERSTSTVRAVPGLPDGIARVFAEDRAGTLWIGYDDGLLVRIRDGAAPEVFGAREHIPAGMVTLLFDANGRLWLTGDAGGVARIDAPSAPQLHVTTYTVAQGLSSNQALCLVDDLLGRIYVGTSRGIDRIDPATNTIAHFDTADGLPNNYVVIAHRDRNGALWFGTKAGIARIVPRAPERGAVPAIYIARIVASGTVQPLAREGTRDVHLGVTGDQLDIAFTSPAFAVGDPVRFQYQLGDDAWSAPIAEREVHYARLAPGSYRFAVRAVTASGVMSEPAVVDFIVMPPIWARWWFLAACALVAGGVGYFVVRARLRHVLAIERIRTRIATDLHDELGANLSRISILAEVATQRAAANETPAEQVADIGASARELVEVASDIVWSTDPRRDDLGSLLVRLRRFAADVLEGRGIAWTLTAPPDPQRVKLNPDQRRHLHLVIKEAINNAAKHSQAHAVTIEVGRVDRALVATISDDGRGFDPATAEAGDGNGVANMHARARASGGSLVLASRVGHGTTITLRMPLRGA